MRAVTLAFILLGMWSLPSNASSSTNCHLTAFGAVGDGKTLDTKAVQAAFDSPTCSQVVVDAGHTFLTEQVNITQSNWALTFEDEATLQGDPSFGVNCMNLKNESVWWTWCAYIRVSDAVNVSITGNGVIAGGGDHSDEQHYSTLHMLSLSGMTLGGGLRIHCTNHAWCTVGHNLTDVTVNQLFVDGSTGRDGFDLVNVQNVHIVNSTIQGSDDGLVFKTQANHGLESFPTKNVLVENCFLSSRTCNAIQFGSHTFNGFFNMTFRNITVHVAPKAAIGVTMMDGGDIDSVTFQDFMIDGGQVASPVFVKLGQRTSDSGIGIIQNILFQNINAPYWGYASSTAARSSPPRLPSYSITVTGDIDNVNDHIKNVTFINLSALSPGGHPASDSKINPPSDPTTYQPRYLGVRPSWGLFIRRVTDLVLRNVTLGYAETDGRPVFVVDDVTDGTFMGPVTVSNASATTGCQIMERNTINVDTRASGLDSCHWNSSE